MTNLEFKTQLEKRTKEFAVAAFKYLDVLPMSESIELRNLFHVPDYLPNDSDSKTQTLLTQ